MLPGAGTAASHNAPPKIQTKPAASAPQSLAGPTKMPGPKMSSAERDSIKRAYVAAKNGDISGARRSLAAVKDARAREVGIVVAEWIWLRESESGADFETIARFIEHHPEWPSRDTLYRRADEVIDSRIPDARVLAWYAKRKPRTGNGFMRFSEALAAAGRQAEATLALRTGWTEGNFTDADEEIFYSRHRQHLTADDHATRTDRLLWERQIAPARRMLPRLQGGQRKLAEARLVLITKSGNADLEIAQVPDDLLQHPGLLYDRVRWRREKGLEEGLDELLSVTPDDSDRGERWWRERHAQVRTLLTLRRPEDAYRLAADHKQASPRRGADAEWLAGWIALRRLSDPQTAKMHFARFYDAVRYPVSVARGAYWMGRAVAQAGGDAAEIRRWYGIAASHPTTFYGQLSLLALDQRTPLKLPADPEVNAQQILDFDRLDLTQAVRMLAWGEQKEAVRTFITRLNYRAKTAAEHLLTARLARDVGRVDLSVVSAKKSAQQGFPLIGHSFPLLPELSKPAQNPEPALMLAVSRQESEFDPGAISSAGARGLMQLMPATAKKVAAVLRLPFKPKRLTDDSNYNAALGRRYLAQLLDEWDGNYVLTLASYNAGGQRVRQWLELWGDPRRGDIDMIDWIELIPFSETRNYVQRTLESTQIYRQLLTTGASRALQLDNDLHLEKGIR
jgi:soluble lytic murein transglycosylase